MSETPNGLRGEMAAACFDPGAYVGPRGARTTDQWRADACIAGPLAPIFAQVSALQAEVERLQKVEDELADVSEQASRWLEACDELRERLQKVEGEREKGRVPDGTGLSPKGEAPDGSSSQSDFDPSRGPLADFARQMIRHAWNGEDVDGGTIQDTAASLGLLREEPYDPKKHGGTTLCEIGDTWFVFAGPLARASDEHPAGEDPKGLRAKPASAVGEAEAPPTLHTHPNPKREGEDHA